MNTLNEDAALIMDVMRSDANRLRIAVSEVGGATLIDCGIATQGGLEAGRGLAEVCLARRGEVSFVPSPLAEVPGLAVQVTSDDPVLACLGSQYAGWQVSVEKYFAMGSGPMRAIYAKEKLFEDIGYRESPPFAIGVFETAKLPPTAVIAYLAERLGLPASRLTLFAAPCASLAGSVQVVARALETALHKMHELGFNMKNIVSGCGVAPLPPIASDEITAIGRTNDAILYGGLVTIWLREDEDRIAQLGPKIPSSASSDHGVPFAQIFERYNRDFYKIDQHLFSPAVIALVNLKTGRQHTFGKTAPEVVQRSFQS